ncbi:major pollen allergen Ole e 10-like [Primulina huaijiensis]|uniref:major pollen allergen Ole e 10-like n=1 Tax=Primulina huaijiensis TaxID=1492673 RepID=UPI003CC6E08C
MLRLASVLYNPRTTLDPVDIAAMAKAFVALFFLLLSVSALFQMRSSRGQEMHWCVAKPSSEQVALNDNIQYACNNLADCRVIQPGGACYLPNNLINHASVVMNLYFQSRGRQNWNCEFGGTGLRVITDPSYGSCSYNDTGDFS